MLPNSITSKELYELTGYSKASIIEFEQSGLIARSATNEWPIGTVTTLIAKLRERKPAVSEQRMRWEQARAAREELKAQQLAGTLCKTSDFDDAWLMLIGALLSRLVALPNRVTRDLALRKRIEHEIDQLRREVADEAEKWASELGGKGKAA